MTAYYNEIDRYKAEWLRELIKAKLIADGEVDERSIAEVFPADIAHFTQCHWFAGIGSWSYALRSAGWSDDRPVWTASCPCQPFSKAGRGAGFADERHLWPYLFHFVGERKPDVLFGEQVGNRSGAAWLDLVCADVEAIGYAIGATVLPAAGFGAPHARHRIYFVAHPNGRGFSIGWSAPGDCHPAAQSYPQFTGEVDDLADADSEGFRGGGYGAAGSSSEDPGGEEQQQRIRDDAQSGGAADLVDDAGDKRLEGYTGNGDVVDQPQRRITASEIRSTPAAGATRGFWSDADWIYCRPEHRFPDGSYRPVESGTFPLADGTAERVELLRGYGDSICAPAATEFIRAYIDAFS